MHSSRMNPFRAFVDPFEGLLKGEVSYTTAIVRPKVPHEKRKAMKKRAEIMGVSVLLLVGAVIAGFFKWELIYNILFAALLICLSTYAIVAAFLHMKVEAYETVGIVFWQKDCFGLTYKQDGSARTIPYESVRFLRHKEGIPRRVFSKSRNQNRDFTSIILELELKDHSFLTIELLYTSNYRCTDPDQSLKIKPLTEQLLKFIFKDYTILDQRALKWSKL